MAGHVSDVTAELTPIQVKNNKQRDNAAAEQEELAKRRGSDKENEDDTGPPDVLGEREDNDVIF